ncbi:MAG: DMT family transporter [Schleiferiaceae bacterium]|nr:DMT family transporter [Schleiferiaceae bacterium]
MIYLFLSILTSGLIFIIFKGFSKYEIDNAQAIITNYVVAFSLGLISSDKGLSNVLGSDWIWVVLMIGVLFISLFILMAQVSQTQGVTIATVAVKMSVAIPVLLGFTVFKDEVTVVKLIAIFLSLIAILLVTTKPDEKFNIALLTLPLILFFGNGSLDAILKFAQAKFVPAEEIELFTSLCFGCAALYGFLLYPLRKNKPSFELKNILAGIVLGIPNFGSIYFLLKALEITGLESSVFFPINNIGIVLTSTLLALLIFKEKLALRNWVGIAVGVLSIILISR